MNDKQPWTTRHDAEARESQVSCQPTSSHLVLGGARKSGFNGTPSPPILCSPFDAELFGHWWFEGPLWLEAVARQAPPPLQRRESQLISCAAYLDQFPKRGVHLDERRAPGDRAATTRSGSIRRPAWTWAFIYPAERFTRDVCTENRWQQLRPWATRIMQQLCRELLLLESSDWQFLITTGAARDYAELRFTTHNDQFLELKSIWQAYEATGSLNDHQATRLAAIQHRDSIFPDIDPANWATPPKPPQ